MIVNKNDYLMFDGIDLDIELPDDDNAKDKANRFINEVEMFMNMELKKYGVQLRNTQDFKYAICYQIRHFLKYGRDNNLDNNAWMILHNAGIINALRG